MGYKKGTLSIESREKMRQAKLNNPTRYWLGKGKIKPRKCANCRTLFMPKNYNNKAKFCSRTCITPWNKGKKIHYKVWNAGKKDVYSDEVKKRMGLKNIGKIRSLEFREQVSKKLTKGNTPFFELIRKCFLYREWHKKILSRDNYTCQICNVRGGKLQVDHYPKMFSEIIKIDNIKTLDQAIKNKSLWDISNGRTLCYNCHIKHGRRKPNYE